jgi:hypothetical protein
MFNKNILLPLFIALIFFSVPSSASETCSEVFSVCTDSGDKPLGVGGALISPLDGGYINDCWSMDKVYRCVDDDWETVCNNDPTLLESELETDGYSLVEKDQLEYFHQSFYLGQDISVKEPLMVPTTRIGTTSEYALFLGYNVVCPDSQFIEDSCADNETCNLAALPNVECKAISDWSVTDSSTDYSELYTSSYSPVQGELSFSDLAPANEYTSSWSCTTSVTNSCTETEIESCEVVGTVCTPGSEDPDLPNTAELGNCASGLEYRVCEYTVVDACDLDEQNCSDPFSSDPIYHDVFTGVEIGREVQYMCISDDVTETCDRAGGYDTCQHSYFTCDETSLLIDPAQNIHDGVEYFQCSDWNDFYICPDEVYISCTGDTGECGPTTERTEEFNSNGDLIGYVEQFYCYNGELNDSCGENASHDFYGCVKTGFRCLDRAQGANDPYYGDCVEYVDEYSCPNDATYVCDGDISDCRAPVVREGSSETTDPGDSGESPLEIGRIDDYVCWTGGVNEVCDVGDDVDTAQCNHTGYTCLERDPEKAQPTIIDGRDYGTCISFIDNWVCDSLAESSCDGDYSDCSVVDILDGVEGPVDSGDEDNTVILNGDGVPINWSEEFACYTGDFIEDCDDVTPVEDIHECTKTGFTCLEEDPSKEPDPEYGICVNYIDKYLCGDATYTECDTDFEMCTTSEVVESRLNDDGVEILRRETSFCYTDQINESLCKLEDDRCYLYDENSACESKILQRTININLCLSEGRTISQCEFENPEPTCKTEVSCPTGERSGVSCQINWDNYDAEFQDCLATGNDTADCKNTVSLPECEVENHTFIDCPFSGFTCNRWDYNLTEEQAESNTFQDRNYGYCVDWQDRFHCPQYQTQDCDTPIDDSECGEISYINVGDVIDGNAVDYTTGQECTTGPAPDCVVDDSCELVDVGCAEYSGGLCVRKRQEWSCVTNRTDCVEWDVSCAENSLLNFGDTVNAPNNIGNFIASASVAKMISENTNLNGNSIEIFGGTPKFCRKWHEDHLRAMIAAAYVIHAFSGIPFTPYEYFAITMLSMGIDMNCCKIDTTDLAAADGEGRTCSSSESCDDGYDQSVLEAVLCEQEEVELAKSRGAGYAYEVGKWVSKDLLGYKVESTYGFCEFDNLFSRIVQEQGREQIAQALLQGSVDAITQDISFDYFIETDGGGWNLHEINGNKVAFWSWDDECKNYSTVYNPPEGVEQYLPPVCPISEEIYIASCEGGDCNLLPTNPFEPLSSDYMIKNINSKIDTGLSVSTKMYVSGLCSDDGVCQYKVNAYPEGSGAKTQIGFDVNWSNNVYTPGWSEFSYDIGGYILVPYELGDGVGTSGTVQVKINEVVFDVPVNTNGEQVSIGDLTFIGKCSDDFYSCSYRVYKSVLLNLIPWGEAEAPNCRGFSAQEVEILDFGSMDLQEWIATVLPEPPSEEELLSQAENSIEDLNESMANGDRPSGGVVKVVFWNELIFHPTETVSFVASSKVEIDADNLIEFSRVVVDWGNGDPVEDLFYVAGNFKASHVYRSESGLAGYDVTFTFYATSGRTYTTSVKILIGVGSGSQKAESSLGGGSVEIEELGIRTNAVSGLSSATGG